MQLWKWIGGGGYTFISYIVGGSSASITLQEGSYIVLCSAAGGVGGGYNGSSYAGINWHLKNNGLSNISSLNATIIYDTGVQYSQCGIWDIAYNVILDSETTLTMTCSASGNYNPSQRCVISAFKFE